MAAGIAGDDGAGPENKNPAGEGGALVILQTVCI